MKRLSLFFFLFLLSALANAQFFQLAEGPVFAEPVTGYAKIVQMKNLNTMFLHIDFSKGLNVQVYEAKYKARTEEHIDPAYGVLAAGNIEAIFEVNSDAVVIISNRVENTQLLYRLIIDGTTGKLKEEKQIGILKKPSAKQDTSALTKGSEPGFHVRKDPDSDNYAVAMINDFASDTSKRIEIVIYGSDNNQLKRAYYSSRTAKYKHLQYIDMDFTAPDKVSLLMYGYNITDDGMQAELILADNNNGNGLITFTELLEFSNDLVIDHGVTRYNPQTKRMQMLITAKIRSEGLKANNYMNFIDPFGRKFLSTVALIVGEKVQKKHAALSKKETYQGVPQNLFLKSKGGFTIIYEEMEQGIKDTVSHLTVRNVVVADYDDEAELTGSYYIPMDHDILNAELPAFNQAARAISGQSLSRDNQYKSSQYISDDHIRYVVFNDTENNITDAEKGKMTQLKNVKVADAFYIQLLDKDLAGSRKYVFGRSPDKDIHYPGIFSIFDYDKANNLFVTLKAENEGQHPGIKLVWLQP